MKCRCSEEHNNVAPGESSKAPNLVTGELWGFLTEPWGFHQGSRAHPSVVHAPLLLLQLTDVAVPLDSAPQPHHFYCLYVASLPLVTAADSGVEPRESAQLSYQPKHLLLCPTPCLMCSTSLGHEHS